MLLWIRIAAFAAIAGVVGGILDEITGLHFDGESALASAVILAVSIAIGLGILAMSGWDLGFLETGRLRRRSRPPKR